MQKPLPTQRGFDSINPKLDVYHKTKQTTVSRISRII